MIDVLIGCYCGYEWKFVIIKNGWYSFMYYDMLEVFVVVSLFDVYLEIGCIYQIWVYFVVLYYLCCGDFVYGVDFKLVKRFGLDC